MNKKGMIMLPTVFISLIITSTIIFISFCLIQNSRFSIVRNFDNLNVFIKEKTATERLYKVFETNISRTKPIFYEDINKEYIIENIKTNYQTVEVIGSINNFKAINFDIKNITDIFIDLDFIENEPNDEDEDIDGYYNVELLLNGESIFTDIHKVGATSSVEIKIPKELIVDIDEEELNYGEYSLVISVNDGVIDYKINYEKQIYREAEIIDEKEIKKKLIIDADKLILGI